MKKIKYLASAAILAACAGATIAGNNASAVDSAKFESGANSIQITRTITDIPQYVTTINDLEFTYTLEPVGVSNSDLITSVSSPQLCNFNNVAVTNGTATTTCSLDLSDLEINGAATGIYQIRITETASSNPTEYPVADINYLVNFILRRNKEDSTLDGAWYEDPYLEVISATNGGGPAYQGSDSEKHSTLVYSAPMIEHSYIELTKDVTGAFANLTETFHFNVMISAQGNTDTYHIGNKVCTVGTLCEDVAITGGDVVRIGYNESTGLGELIPTTMSYTITETGATDYTTSVTYNMIESGSTTVSSHTASNTKTVTSTVLPASTTGANQNGVKFTNTRDDSILNDLTGVFFNILPYITLAGASIFGVILVKKSKQ